MAKQTINQGTAPTGAGGDTFRSGSAKLQANDDEIYNYLGDGTNLNKLGTAAFKNVGVNVGNLAEAGLDGWTAGVTSPNYLGAGGILNLRNCAAQWLGKSVIVVKGQKASHGMHIGCTNSNGSPRDLYICTGNEAIENWGSMYLIYNQANTTVDANGFIKSASPIVKLFADRTELNDEAQQQEITFEKLGTGDYLIKGSTGFSQDGWYIETPKDANGNLLVAVVYEQLENGDISVKTYDYMLNNKGRIVTDTETPLDIPEARWIDLRLQEIEVTDDPEQ